MKNFDSHYTTLEFGSDNFDPGTGQYETYGKDLEFIQNFPNKKKIWTVVDGDGSNSNMYILAGYHLCNRFSYVISDQEWKDETEEYIWNI